MGPFRHVTGALLVLFAAFAVFALDPDRALTQARLSLWTPESGLPQGTIHVLLQTRDGYLWMGTEEGLARFDGARLFVYDRQNAPALRSAFVSALFEDRDGTLWIGTYGGGLARLRHGVVEGFHHDLLGTDRIREMHAAADGTIFIATAGGGLLRIEGDRITRFTTRNGLPTDRLWAIEDDGEGGLWIGTHGGGVVRWRDSRVQERLTTREGLPNDFARALLRDPDGTLWIGTDGGGLAVWRNGSIARTITTRDGLTSDLIRTLRRDRNNSLWIGTDVGLARWRGERAEVLGVAEGMPSPTVRAMVEDRESNLWIGTAGGLVRLRDTRFLSFTRREGLPVGSIRPIIEDDSGRVWLGTEGGGLCTIAPLRCFTKADGLPEDTIYALAVARDGGLWVGTSGGGVVRFRDGKFFETIDARSGLPNNRVSAIVETDEALWISTSSGLAHVRDGRVSRVAALNDRQLRPLLVLPDRSVLVGTDGEGLWRASADGSSATNVARAGRGLESDRIFTLALDSDGKHVWIGTSGGGLARLDLASGTVRSVTRRNGLHDDVVFQVVEHSDDLWLTSNRGLYRIARDRVIAAMNGAKADLSGIVYGTSDGLPSNECNAAFPAALRVRDGHLWVATAHGVAVVDPTTNRRNTIAPPVHVEEALIDGAQTAKEPLRIPPGAQRLELRYTAVGLRAPERVTFRYMLEGYDHEWVEAGTSRVAHYTKLAPGDYTFRVTAANEDGVASDGEARLAVTVARRWFETWWARLLGIALVVVGIWLAVRLRLAALHARHAELEALVAARTRELGVANERLRALSYVDGLTGVANRRRFDEALEEACTAAQSQGAPVSLVLIDLDHFKSLNDSQGHQNGDEALRTVGALLIERTESRGGLAARFGGEEFAWLLPGIPLASAQSEAEQFRLSIRNAAIRHEGSTSGIVTASFGVSATNGTHTTPLSLVASADAALYRAKSRGRDRVEVEG